MYNFWVKEMDIIVSFITRNHDLIAFLDTDPLCHI